MKRISLFIMCLSAAGMGQLFPVNPRFSTEDISRWNQWDNGAATVTLTYNETDGAEAPGCLHAVFTGSGHAEVGVFYQLPSQLIGGKELEFRAKGKLINLDVVCIVYWYLDAAVLEQWQHVGVFEGTGEWKSPNDPCIKQIEPASSFSQMRLAFYCFNDPATTSSWEFLLDDIQLIVDGEDVSSDQTPVIFGGQASNKPCGISSGTRQQEIFLTLMGRKLTAMPARGTGIGNGSTRLLIVGSGDRAPARLLSGF